MKQLKNFLIKREQSQARLSFAKREKSRLLAKTILTLVALLAVTTGAWAAQVELKLGAKIKNGDVLTFGDTRVHFATPCSLPYVIFSAVNTSTTARISYNDNVYSITFSPLVDATDIEYPDVTQQGVGAALGLKTGQTQPEYVMVTEGTGTFADPFILTPYATYNCEGTPVDGKAICDASDPSAIKVAWDGDKKTGTFDMPGGNVTLEPEYYPQATVADGGVTAADADARATTDDPLVKVDATKLTGAKKLMYFVSNSGTTAPAYDAEGWTDVLPTAEGFTQQGIVYVWYYPVGTDEGVDEATATYSDGDICLQSITARIAAAPTYAVSLKEGTEDADKWTIEPTEAKPNTEIKATYSGNRRVKGVKAVKKAVGKPVATLTAAPTPWGYICVYDDIFETLGTAEGGTLMYKVTTTDVKPTSTEGFSTSNPKGVENSGGNWKNYIWYYIKGDDSHSDSEIFGPIEVNVWLM